MKKRISKRVRDEAALICGIAALSTNDVPYYDDIAVFVGVESSESWRLAIAAWSHAGEESEAPWISWTRQRDAEAESLIRTGWSPE